MIACNGYERKKQTMGDLMDAVFLAGRILFVAMFVFSGMNHWLQRENMTAYARSNRVPFPSLLVPLTGLMIVVGGGLVGLGLWGDLGALLIAGFLAPTAYYMHGFWRERDPMMRMQQMAHFEKNVAMLGAALALFYVFNHFGPQLPLTLGDGKLFPQL
jgi:putative oxidoreductase